MGTVSPDNIFHIPYPSEWYCKLQYFQEGHGMLKIKVHHLSDSKSPLYIEFRKVGYYSGWLSWQGAAFKLVSDDELLNFVRLTTRAYDGPTQDELLTKLEHFRLFVCYGTDDATIHIIANAGWCTDGAGNTLVEPLIYD